MSYTPPTPDSESPDWLPQSWSGLPQLFRTLLRAQGLAFDPALASRAWTELERDGNPVERLQPLDALREVGERLGVRIKTGEMPLSAIVAAASDGIAMATLYGNADTLRWLVLLGSKGRKLRVATPSGEVLLTRRQLQSELNLVDAQANLPSISAQAGLAIQSEIGNPHAEVHRDSDSHAAHVSPVGRLYQFLRPESGDIGIVAVFAAVVGLLALATPLAVEALINTVAFGRLLQPIVVICLMLLVFLGFAAALRILQVYVAELIQRRLFLRVVADLSYRLPRVDQTALDAQHGPELLNRFFEVVTLQKSAALLVLDGVAIVLQTFIGMAVLVSYDTLFLGFDLFLLASLAFVTFALGHGGFRTALAESRAKYAVGAWLQQIATATNTFKSTGGPAKAVERADHLAHDYLVARRQHFRVLLRQSIFALALQAISGSLVLGLGGWLVIQGQLTLGQLVAAELIVAIIVGSFAKLGKQLESFYDLLTAVDKLGHLTDLPIERQTGVNLKRGPEGLAVQVRKMSLALAPHASPTPNHLNFSLETGDCVAVTGPPGSGKSLLVDILYGTRQPGHGHVTIEDFDLRTIQPRALRESVAMVRGVELFAGTIIDNLHMDRRDVGNRDVQLALHAVGLFEELMALPDGLETFIQPSGTPLSGSQVSRLMLARALAARPRLLLIDGLLDSLPDECLSTAMQAIQALRPTCTVMIVTGHKAVCAMCPRTIVLGDGLAGLDASGGYPHDPASRT